MSLWQMLYLQPVTHIIISEQSVQSDLFLTILMQLAKIFEVVTMQSNKAIISVVLKEEDKQTLPLSSLKVLSALAAHSFPKEGVIALILI